LSFAIMGKSVVDSLTRAKTSRYNVWHCEEP